MTDFMTGQYREDLGLGAKAASGAKKAPANAEAKAAGEGARSTHTHRKGLVPMFQVVPGFSQGAELRSATDEDWKVTFERVGIGLAGAYEIYVIEESF
jgi:hypothetical protein